MMLLFKCTAVFVLFPACVFSAVNPPKIPISKNEDLNVDFLMVDVDNDQPGEPADFTGFRAAFDAYYAGPSVGFEFITWGYHDPVGPDMWPFLFRQECGRLKQSPIAIDTQSTVHSGMPPVILYGYNATPMKMKAFNNGHIAKFKVKGRFHLPQPAAYVSGQSLSYEIEDMHFHWGSHNYQGSEHTIDGVRYPAELHIVHKLQGLPVEEAVSRPGGIAVLGILLEIGSLDNKAYEPLLNALRHIIYKNETFKFFYNLPLRSLLPDNVDEFYRYEGSLTTPMCNENVIWTVYRNPTKLSWRQLLTLRGLVRTERGVMPPLPMVDNFRPTQNLNGRTVFRVGF